MAKHITLKQLERLDACEEQIALFKQLFGREDNARVQVTPATARALAHSFSVRWLAGRILSDKQRKRFDKQRAQQESWLSQQYHNQRVALNTMLGRAHPQYDALQNTISRDYCARYHEMIAQAFVDAYHSPKRSKR
jgi:hypothetical protein